MKIEVVNRRNAVEVRQLNDDGTMTVYLCENPQAALFKIASLVYSIEEPKEEAKRSILVGTFGEKKKQPERPNLEEIAKKVAEEMEKQGKFIITVPPPINLNPPDPFPGAAIPYVNPLVPYAGGQVHIVPCGIGGIGSGDLPEIDVNAAGAVGTGQAPADGQAVNINAIIADLHSSHDGCFGIQDEELGGNNLAMFSAEFGPKTKVFKTSVTMSP